MTTKPEASRTSSGRASAVDRRDPRVRIWVQGFRPDLEGKLGTTFSLANGMLGMRGAHPECPSWGRPELYCAGTDAGGPPELLGFHDPDHILSHPERITRDAKAQIGDNAIWTLPNLPFPLAVLLTVGDVPFSFESPSIKLLSNERMLRIDDAVLQRCMVYRDDQGRRTRVDSDLFASFADRNLLCMRYTVRRLGHAGTVRIVPRILESVTNTNGVILWRPGERLTADGLQGLECVTKVSNHTVAVVQAARQIVDDDCVTLEICAAVGAFPLAQAAERATAAAAAGFAACREAHLAAYRREAEAAQVTFDGDVATVQGFNFGQMHLQMAFSPITDRVGIPIKGYTGHGYRFLNFWDTDFHMFPYYLLTRPREAHKLLEFRYGQLDQYRANARAWGCKGAQVPWETNSRGVEETAPWLCLQEREIHISADAAYMFALYHDLTGDHRAMVDMGAEFTFETARYYASRLVWSDARQCYELPDIGCPDQYHTFADNNVFISRFAKWNLQQAAGLAAAPEYRAAAAKVGLTEAEATTWAEMAAKLLIIAPDADGIIEEFDGYFGLDPDLSGIAETYCSHSQAVKQPDVLATFVPFEDDYDVETRRRNWHFYNDRTLHGSSLSFPGMAYAAARCGLNDEALYHLHKSSRMDIDDVNLDSERGVHLSGGALEWMTLVRGFGGVTPRPDGLHFAPNLPRQWQRLDYVLHWHFQKVAVALRPAQMTLHSPAANNRDVPIFVLDQSPVALQPGATITIQMPYDRNRNNAEA